MSAVYDNWERLVAATLRRERDRYLARIDSLSSASDTSSSFRSEPSESFRLLNFPGYSFNYTHLLHAIDGFSNTNLLKHGHSGDFFRGYIPHLSSILARDNQIRPQGSINIFNRKKKGSTNIVIKRIDLRLVDKEIYLSELNILSTVPEASKFSLFLGFCQKDEKIYIVYKYASKGDLSSFFPEDGYLQSLDWTTRLNIAIGAAERLVYLHDECTPSFAHGDVQASSILVDDQFNVWLGSLSKVCMGNWDVARTYDVHCFGKVLLELVTGMLGMRVEDRLSGILSCIESFELEVFMEKLDGLPPPAGRYSHEFMDPSLKTDDWNLMDEVWGVAFIARACLNPMPRKRPLMRDVLYDLKNARAKRSLSIRHGRWYEQLASYVLYGLKNARANKASSLNSTW